MKMRRKFLQMIDLRVHQHRTGLVPTNSYRLGRLRSIESLATEHPEYATFVTADGKTRTISSM